MRILQLVSSLGIGGAERFVTDLSSELARLGHQVTLLVLDRAENVGKSSHYENKLKCFLEKNKVKVLFVRGSGRKNPFNVYSALFKTIKNSRPDIIHSHLLIWSIYLTTINKNIKHIFTQHTDRLKAPFLHKFLKYRINGYIPICDQASEKFKAIIAENKIHQIANGINTKKFTNLNRPATNKKTRFVTVSRLSDEKNHSLIIEAAHKLVENKINNFEINIIGQGVMELELKDNANKLNLSEFITFHGTRSDIPKVLVKNDVYLLPSKFEGFSISLIEALSSGIKIIASDVGGNAEILGHGQYGKLIPANNLQALINAMKLEIDTSGTDNRNKDNLKSHLHELSIETSAKKHLELYSI